MATLEDLAEYAANFECPPPPAREPFEWVFHLQVPGAPETPLEELWQPGDTVEMPIQEGIVNAVGGGSCVIWRAQAIRPGVEERQPAASLLTHPDCLPVPEPPVQTSLAVALLAVLVVRRLRGKPS